MEYEQLETGNRIIHQTILNQDTALYYDLLAPDVLLVTHFPYPEYDNPNVAPAAAVSPTFKAARERIDREKRTRQLLQAQAARRDRQQQRYDAHLVNQAQKERRRTRQRNGGDGDDDDEASGNEMANDITTATSAAVAGIPVHGGDSRKKSAVVAGAKTAVRQRRSVHGSESYRSLDPTPLRGGDRAGSTTAAHRPAVADGISFYFAQPPPVESAVIDDCPVDSLQSDTTPAVTKKSTGSPAGRATPSGTRPERTDIRAHYGRYVDVTEGRELACERMGFLLEWLTNGDFIVEVQTQFEARKGILQDAEVLPPPPTPQTPQEEYAQLGRQFTDRNQRLSRLTVIWGREYLLFADQCYFDDGCVVTIHRRFLTLPEMLHILPITAPYAQRLTVSQRTDRIRQSLGDFYGMSKSRVAAVNHAWPVLDYSFRTVEDIVQLLRVKPSSGRAHTPRSVRPIEDPRLAQGVFLNADNDPTKSVTRRTLIKAKNKQGDEEAYEFEHGRQRYQVFDRQSEEATDGFEENLRHGTNTLGVKFSATSVRISSCHLQRRMERFTEVLRSVIANVFVTVSVLDLSDNELTVLPNLSRLPLQKLLLHANCISNWMEVEDKVCPLPFLTILTLHGNPISDRNPHYWPLAISQLMRHPNRRAKLRQLDFVTLTAQDYNMAAAYEKFTPSSQKPIHRT